MEAEENAIIVGVLTKSDEDYESYYEEMERLVEALGLFVCSIITQELSNPNPATYVGRGKLLEIDDEVKNQKVEYVIFAETLSPAQHRNITKQIKVRVLDRTGLILEIFKRRARSRESKLQVEMANLQYTLPRLVGMWNFFGRQAGGGGSRANKGAGEKQLELDRRTIERRISELRRVLDTIEHDRSVQRKARSKSNIPKVALVGYTNAGKSTLMNCLLERGGSIEEKRVFEKDMLFATLDTSVRRISTGDKKDFLLSDTVGFVSNLPHGLIKAFRSTLDEVRYADLLLLVIDAGDPENQLQTEITIDTLKELGAEDIPRIVVMNKTDTVSDRPVGFDEYNDRIYISAKTGFGIDELLTAIKSKIYENNHIIDIIVSYNEGSKINLLNECANIISREYLENGVRIIADFFLRYKTMII